MAEQPAKPKRRRHSVAEKRQIVEESFDPKTSVARVARAHEVNANQVFAWRRLYQRGQLSGTTRPTRAAELLPVTISDSAAAPVPSPIPPPALAGTIQLHVPRGRLRIEGAVDPESLRVVLECLLA